ncbi:Right handed beta helix region [Chitinophaga sp. CF118]|uniref:right-handed parallel beta-helix repeat-containing protein n=1 Tax=Chitinophaga sp. CF118 TaxID=1884367 RepID=UPI0008E444E1|nr:right-handed parallel beta-helix repeat-containing protein [Chitinophaga sp. CF118]SFD09363.1 Right handed beta helix region [Chitinophaga sp. CF118]
MRNTLAVCMFILVASACKKENVDRLNNKDALAVSTLAVTNYYVNATTGNDANTGTTDLTALKTIQAALNKTTDGAGATIWVAGGTYSERLVWPNSGADSISPITLTNYAGGTVILDGASTAGGTQGAMISISSKSHLRINNIRIANNIRANASGINISGAGTDIQVTSCKLYNIGYTADSTAVAGSGDNANPLVVVGSLATSYNKIYIGSNEIYSCNTGYSESLTLNGNIENFLIESNVVHHNRNIGIDIAGHYAWANPTPSVNYARNGNVKYNIVHHCVSPVAVSAGIYVDGAQYVNVEGNTIYQNGTGVSVGCENNNYTADNINIRDNFIYNNIDAGIFMGSNQANSKVTNSSITNNVFYKNNTKDGWIGEINLQNTDYLKIKNNIIQSGNQFNMEVIALLGYASTNLSMDYNRYYSVSGVATNVAFDWGGITQTGYGSLADFTTATGLDAHSTYGTPGLVSATNFHLASGSACINAGDPAFVTGYQELDIDKQTRKQGTRVDIGADETAN